MTVTGVDDALDDGDVATNITLSIDDGASDNFYDDVPNHTVVVTTLDNDEPLFTLVELVGANLVVTDALGVADNLIVSRNEANIRLHDPANPLTAGAGTTQVNANTVEIAFATVTGNLALNTGAGADTVTLDFTGGDPIPAGGLNYAFAGLARALPDC